MRNTIILNEAANLIENATKKQCHLE